MNEITLLAKSGLGWQGIGGIILLLTGVGLIYFGIKALQGYRFFPEQEYNIPEEDHYEPTQAKALQKIKTTMPDFNGGEDRVFTEWKIGYTVDGEKYTQIVTDNGYEKGDMIDIKKLLRRKRKPRKKRRKRLSAMRLSLSVSCLAFSVSLCL